MWSECSQTTILCLSERSFLYVKDLASKITFKWTLNDIIYLYATLLDWISDPLLRE